MSDYPPDLNDVLLGFTNYVSNERVRAYNEGVDATIERCARVAERFNDDIPKGWWSRETLPNTIAAAIRALKDEPQWQTHNISK